MYLTDVIPSLSKDRPRHIYIYIYVYIEREREREREIHQLAKCVYIYVYVTPWEIAGPEKPRGAAPSGRPANMILIIQ